MNGEIPKPVVIRKSISNPETGGTLTVIQKQDKIAESVGHLFAVPSHILLGRIQNIGKNPSPELVDQIIERWKDVPWKGEVVVRIGHVDPKEDWERTRKHLKEEGKLNPLIDVIGKVNQTITGLSTRINRRNNYSLLTHTIHVMNPDIATAMHELGHAEDLLNKKKRIILFDRLLMEYRASANASKRALSGEERKVTMRKLEPAFATYVGGTLQMIGTLIGLPVWSKPIFTKEIHISKRNFKFSPRVPLVFFGTVALSHLYTHLPWRKSTFGYVFEGSPSPEATASKAQEPLQPNQVYTATAKAK